MWKRTQKTPPPPVPPRLFPILRHGAVEIHGTFEGTLWAEGDVVVSRTGRAVGGIKGRHVMIQGELDGQLHSDGTVLIQRRAKVKGSLRAQLLVVEPGARCRVACTVGTVPDLLPVADLVAESAAEDTVPVVDERGALEPLVPSVVIEELQRMVIPIASIEVWKHGSAGAGGSRIDRGDAAEPPLPRAA